MESNNLPVVLEALTANSSNKNIIKSTIIQNEFNKKILYSTLALLVPALFFPMIGIPLVASAALAKKLIKSKKLTLELENKERIRITNITNSVPALTEAMENNQTTIFVVNNEDVEDAVVVPNEEESEIEKFINILRENEKIFLKNNNVWTIRYNKEFIQLKDFKGPNYIQYLLSKPNKHIGLAELYNAINGGDLLYLESIIDGHTVDAANIRKDNERKINDIRERLKKLDQKYNKADFENNDNEMSEIDNERIVLEENIKKLEDEKYHIKKNISKERIKVSNLLRKSFYDFYHSINSKENLYLHLNGSIRVDNGYKYRTEDDYIPWLLN